MYADPDFTQRAWKKISPDGIDFVKSKFSKSYFDRALS